MCLQDSSSLSFDNRAFTCCWILPAARFLRQRDEHSSGAIENKLACKHMGHPCTTQVVFPRGLPESEIIGHL